MRCLKCNSEISDESVFCTVCGVSVVSNSNNKFVEANEMHSTTNDSNNLGDMEVPRQENQMSDISGDINSVVQNNVINNPLGQVKADLDFNNNVVNEVSSQMNYDTNNTFSSNDFQVESPKEKSSFKVGGFLLVVLIVVILGVAGFFGYKFFVISPKGLFVEVLDNATNYLSANVKDNIDSISTNFDFKITGIVVDDDVKSLFDMIKNVTLSGNAQIDYKNQNIRLNIDTKYNNQELIKLNGYVKNNKAYIDLLNLYNKLISYEVKGMDNGYKNYTYDILTILKEGKDAFSKSLKDKYFVTEKVKMSVNGEESKVDKITLLLNYNNLKSLFIDMFTLLKDNDVFLDSFVKIMQIDDENITKQSLIISMEDAINELQNSTESEEGDISIILYTKGMKKDFVGFAIENNIDSPKSYISFINDKKNTYTFKINNGEIEEEILIERNGDNYTLKFEEDQIKVEAFYNKKNADLKIKILDEYNNLDINIIKEKDGKFKINFSTTVDENTIGIEMSFLTKYNESVTIPSLSPEVDIDSLNEVDLENIITKLLENQGIQSLFKDIAREAGIDLTSDVTYTDLMIILSSL